jgi:hypothetical protein
MNTMIICTRKPKSLPKLNMKPEGYSMLTVEVEGVV